MPDISKIKLELSKQIDVSQFFGELAYITIKKLKKSDKKKIQLYSIDGSMSKLALKMYKENKGQTEFDNAEIGRLYMELPKEERAEAELVAQKVEEIYLTNGIDPNDHNLTDGGKTIELDVDFWELFPQAGLFVINKIKEFNLSIEDYRLGETKESKSIIQ